MKDQHKMKEVPLGSRHLAFVTAVGERNRQAAAAHTAEYEPTLRLLGSCMAGLYLSATCHRQCMRGDHLVETLGARAYNIAFSAYSLIEIGMYDESMSVIRSLGELSNLISLFKSDKDSQRQWCQSNKSQRIKNFGPAAVRRRLEQLGGDIRADKDWYSQVCEAYTHVSPILEPNDHGIEKNVCGGIFQKTGYIGCIEQLTRMVLIVALDYCRYAKLDDVYQEIQIAAKAWAAI